ncbi:MarR family winged helix-turn-helix transcriptional regulator [Rhizobium mayense]|uniref:MarR family winged helix-turn-helix transcriptional regulator n=1 Tax=Rhizobium mayense TaxID=1312184 RepID=A0ABT7JVC5_9HYPH|nr:MarR family winged helix-turn-helix transcriptional regulator [Rhizobium mayense]MDL2400291.1 MarR family winged helix-turn-helix transcriptional regulator [Rhizobium mayense]
MVEVDNHGDASDFDIPSQCNCTKIRRAARRMTRLYDVCIAESGVKITQYSILGYLKHRGPKTMLQLADLLAMDRATIGHNLRPLERDGFVTIEVSKTDRRARIVTVTEKGLACVDAGRPGWDRAQAEIDRLVGINEAEVLRSMADDVAERLGKQQSF